METSAPYNWCDGRCERCPLQPTCKLAKRLAGSRWQHEMRGEDPDDPDVVMAEIEDDLRRALRILERDAREQGIDLQAPREPVPTPLLARRLKQAGFRYAQSIRLVLGALDDERAAALRSAALLVAMKCARLGGHVEMRAEDDAEDDAAYDALPNRMLLEHADEQVGRALEGLSGRVPRDVLSACEAARRAVSGLLDFAFGPVPAEFREAFEAMKAAGRAPSPFCIAPRDEDPAGPAQHRT